MAKGKISEIDRRKRAAALERLRDPSIYEYSTLRIDSEGVRVGENKQPVEFPTLDIHGNLVASDAPRPSYIRMTRKLKTNLTAKLTDVSGRLSEPLSDQDLELDDTNDTKSAGVRTTKGEGLIRQQKCRFWEAASDVYEQPLLPDSQPSPSSKNSPVPLLTSCITDGIRHVTSRL